MRIAPTYFLGVGIIFLLLNCSNESAPASRTDAREESASNNLKLPKSEGSNESTVKVVGEFTNSKSDGEHQWGFSVQLWKQDDRVYGIFSGSSNPRAVGDPPTGILVEQILNPETGRFSFATRLPGTTFYFDGLLTNAVLKGRLLDSTTKKTEEIVLKRSKELSSEMMEDYKSYGDWKLYVDSILKFRGREAN
jgi:hypothetical protein